MYVGLSRIRVGGRPGSGGGSAPPSSTTLDPAFKGTLITLSGGNLTATTSAAGAWGLVRSTNGYSTGKKYFEVVLTVDDAGAGNVLLGYCNSSALISHYLGQTVASRGYAAWRSTPISYYNAGSSGILGTVAAVYPTDILGLALDIDTQTATLYLNGALAGAINTHTTPTGAGTYYAAVALFNTRGITARFSSASWSYPAPSGYGQW